MLDCYYLQCRIPVFHPHFFMSHTCTYTTSVFKSLIDKSKHNKSIFNLNEHHVAIENKPSIITSEIHIDLENSNNIPPLNNALHYRLLATANDKALAIETHHNQPKVYPIQRQFGEISHIGVKFVRRFHRWSIIVAYLYILYSPRRYTTKEYIHTHAHFRRIFPSQNRPISLYSSISLSLYALLYFRRSK